MTLRESALAHNTAVMQSYVDRHGLLLAPHMKTHMAPALADRQVRAGAWGVTVASVQQAMVAWAHGVHRILVANEVLDPAGLAWLASRRSVDPDADVLCNVDSVAGEPDRDQRAARLRAGRDAAPHLDRRAERALLRAAAGRACARPSRRARSPSRRTTRVSSSAG
jgi:D-serine deaminase-like pyridoxal phosphate-dependent protein